MARVLSAKGLKGGLRVELLTDWPDELTEGTELWPEDGETAYRISRVERGGRALVLHLEGIGSREAAEPLIGRFLERPPRRLEAGTYFWEDLVGLRVADTSGRPVGNLVEVFRAGGNEVYRVVGPAGERLVPALRSVVKAIDLDAGIMIVADDDAEEIR